MRKKLMVATTLATLSMGAWAQSWLSRQMYTLNPSLQIYGPRQDAMSTQEYRTKIFRIILEEGHDKAREYLTAGDHAGYWGFMVAALTVPLHEGSNIHFRLAQNNGRVCQTRSNSGQIVNHSSHYSSTFRNIFKSGQPQPVPDCSVVNDDPYVNQILHGADGSDIGIMQVNMRWHERNFLATGDWTYVRKSVRYGLALLKQGYDGVYRSTNRYSCVLSNGAVNYTNLIRAAWAGMYNSGNLGASCRFANPNSEWAANDRKFKSNLDIVLDLDNSSTRRSKYPLNSVEDGILDQIIRHFKNKTASASFLQNYLATPSVAGLDQLNPALADGGFDYVASEPSRPDPRPVTPPATRTAFENARVYAVTASVLNFRDQPNTRGNDCGDLPDRTEVIAVASFGDWIELQYDEVLSSYEADNHRCNGQLRYAHKDYLRDLGPLQDRPIVDAPIEPVEPVVTPDEPVIDPDSDPSVEQVPVVVVPIVTPTPTPTPVVEQPRPSNRRVGRVTDWVNVREDRPRGYTMAPPTGDTVGPAGAEVIIEETVWNSSNSRYPWYRISAPVHGWIYGQFVVVEGE